jgi:hypothetical protein
MTVLEVLVIERFGPPDVVIDDGSHRGADVIASFTYLFDRMRAGGMYAIEDLDCSFQSGYGGSENPGLGTALGLLDGLVRSLQRSSTRSEAVGAVHVYEDIAFEKLGP